MYNESTGNNVSQLELPGIRDHARSNCCGLIAGCQVVYLGKKIGCLTYGSRGIVKQPLRNRAIVDMGRDGTWHVPYFYLAESLLAA